MKKIIMAILIVAAAIVFWAWHELRRPHETHSVQDLIHQMTAAGYSNVSVLVIGEKEGITAGAVVQSNHLYFSGQINFQQITNSPGALRKHL